MAWLVVCFFIDGTDGLLARRGRVSEVLPMIDGKNIDFITDFITYAFVPAYFIFKSGLVESSLAFESAAFVIVISAIYYGKQGMVSEKNQFSGFPVLWNLVVFYFFFVFNFDPLINTIFIFFFGVLHFLPIEISYPSKNISSDKGPAIVGFSMLFVLLAILYYYPSRITTLIILAYLGFGYFIFLSIKYTWFLDKKINEKTEERLSIND